MKRLLLALTFLTGFVVAEAQQTFSISTSGNTYTPATLTITAGDTVQFAQSSGHPAREVSQTTWNANGNTSNGGFDMMHSGAKLKFNTPGTYYYVCTVHFSMGMKGQIVVNPASTSVDENKNNVSLKGYPNPVVEGFNLEMFLNSNEKLSIEIFNLIGEKVGELPRTEYSAGVSKVLIDMSEYAGGVYVVKVVGDKKVYSLKITK